MKRMLISSLSLIVVFFFLLTTTVYAVPNLMSYQGTLSDAGGQPISSTVSMTFRIYDVETGGTSLWNETQSVQVSNGVFNVKLGSVNPIPSDLFIQDTLYLSIQAASDSEMTPRQRVTSGGFAHKSKMTEQTIIPIGGIIAWINNIPGIPNLPAGWVTCNGQTLDDPESPLNGQIIPDLNGENRFLRGSGVSGGTGGSETHYHTVTFDEQYTDAGKEEYGSSSSSKHTSTTSHLPPYFDIVWIIKIK